MSTSPTRPQHVAAVAGGAPEDIPMDAEQQQAYQQAQSYLQAPPGAELAIPLFAVVTVQDGIPPNNNNNNNDTDDDTTTTAVVTNTAEQQLTAAARRTTQPVHWLSESLARRTHQQPLAQALIKLQGLEKTELTLLERSDLSRQLTETCLQLTFATPVQALQKLAVLGQAVPRRVCQHPFRKNDIVWVCRTCQADETCVLCHECFSTSDHQGHDVNFYHAQAGGCCDCGDPDAWDPAGFCPRHGPEASGGNSCGALPPNLTHRVRGVVPAVVDWMVHTIAANAEQAYSRANPKQATASTTASSSVTGDVATAVAAASADIQQQEEEDEEDHSDPMDLDDDDDDEISVSDMDFPLDHHQHLTGTAGVDTAPTRSQVFSPTAASTPRPHRDNSIASSHAAAAAHALGLAGAAGRGLYLVVHADDIHLKHQVLEAMRYFWGAGMFFSDMVLNQMADALKQYGQLIVWGTAEIVAQLTPAQAHLWMDGDAVACTRVGDLILERAGRLTRHGLFCSILTYEQVVLEQRAVAVLQWLSAVARSCDPLCQTVAECILPNRHLVPLLRADFKMSSRATKAWYSLLLTLLAVPAFKSHLAAAYCDTYRAVTAKYARGMGVLERSGYTLSVQFLNRVAYVVDLVQGRDLLGKLGKSLLDTLLVATRSKHFYNHKRLDPNHFVLAHRRYSPCVSDLKCVLNVAGMPRVTACAGGTFLGDWIAALRVAQFMDPQEWRHWSQGHVEDESRGWVGAFNASISLGSLFERLLGWKDEDESPIGDPTSTLSKGLMSCVELTAHVLMNGVDPWQKAEMLLYSATPFTSSIVPHRRCPGSLPFSTIAAKCGTALAMRELPVSQMTPFSFHLPLHRFVASALRELCLRTHHAEAGMTNLMQRLERMGGSDDLFHGLMEFPVLVLSRVAQVRSDLWKRNGPGLNDQVLNYAEPPFCRNMRDADLLLTQFACLGRTQRLSLSQEQKRHQGASNHNVGMAFLSNLLLHRFGIFDFIGLHMAPNSDRDRYLQESAMGLYPREIPAPGALESDLVLPWTHSAARDSAQFMKLLEEFLHFMVVFISELPHTVPKDRAEQIRQAKYRLFREVVHRLASGPKTHSELSEVHHVLSHWDNVLLNDEGRLLNPDDATGAALAVVLADVADRRVIRSGRPEPDKWELRTSAWAEYDPAFFHISLRSHQTAADNRPKPRPNTQNAFGWDDPKPYAPRPTDAHPFFARLRRDATVDATTVAIAYKVLHMHCRKDASKDLSDLRGKSVYESQKKSETALARSVHLLTLGAYAWGDARQNDTNWRGRGGGSPGSLFFNRMDNESAPTAADWVEACLLQDPRDLLDCDWYQGEENALVLLHRLAVSGGTSGGFTAQDACVRAGAAWLCSFAASHCATAAAMFAPVSSEVAAGSSDGKAESEIEKRKRLAKARAMARIQAQAAKFASTMEVELGGVEQDDADFPATPGGMDTARPASITTPNRPIRAASFGSTLSSASSVMTVDSDSVQHVPSFVSLASEVGNIDLANIPSRLLQTRPRCIICNDEESSVGRSFERAEHDDGEGQRKKSRRRTENALGFVGYAQASTVLKGGGGPPPDLDSPMSPVREFVGVHVALCGHAVHSECCESYLATVSHREDRAIGKRDEFRCPLCQRLSNCLVPFIDVGLDWIDSPICLPATSSPDAPVNLKNDESFPTEQNVPFYPKSLGSYLSGTSWWLARQSNGFVWNGQSAFVDKVPVTPLPDNSGEDSLQPRKPARKMRSLKKKDLYVAWNAMMRTRRFVRRRLRPRNSLTKSGEASPVSDTSTSEETSGETLAWRRFMDQVADISYKADSKRLGDNHLHDLFGEFRHFIVEKYAYNAINNIGRETIDWPNCMFEDVISDSKRQEMSREKLLSKLLMSIQAFTYSCCCEAFEARREHRRSLSSTAKTSGNRHESGVATVLSRYGMAGTECDGHLIILAQPSASVDGGLQPFDGRLGKLRYLGLALVSAAGAVSADLVQLVLPFPVEVITRTKTDQPDRAPIAYPLLLGHVMTHVVAAMCAACGRARAQSDSIDMWQVPLTRGDFSDYDVHTGLKRVDGVVDDCEGFIKLGLLARTLQVLLNKLHVPIGGASNTDAVLRSLRTFCTELPTNLPDVQRDWLLSCFKLLETTLANFKPSGGATVMKLPEIEDYLDSCALASEAAVSFMTELGTIIQVLVPGVMARYGRKTLDQKCAEDLGVASSYVSLERVCSRFRLETVDEMIESALVKEIVAEWYTTACDHSRGNGTGDDETGNSTIGYRLRRTQGFRSYDWPHSGATYMREQKGWPGTKDQGKFGSQEQPHDDSLTRELGTTGQPNLTSDADLLRQNSSRALVTFSSKKSVPLLGGVTSAGTMTTMLFTPRVTVIPTSYTDLYAELGALMPDSEQTAVCLICGEVLNAGGKGECTRHSYKCGAGAGVFFLLQECSGLIMHKSKAAYIHSPYVDSHGETPQYRGRPLNLDLDRYDHLRQVWFSHGVRQQVVAERASSRQVILPDFY